MNDSDHFSIQSYTSGGHRASSGLPQHLPNPIPFVIFCVFAIAGLVVFWSDFQAGRAGDAGALMRFILGMSGASFLGLVAGSTIKIAAQWEKALVFRLGKYKSLKGPGPFFLIPFFETSRVVDTRIRTVPIPHRQAITKDNVPVKIDGVIFMRVSDPGAAVTRVQDYAEAVQEYSQTALRDIVGSMTLDEILADREKLGREVQEMVTTEIDGWGLDVAAIRIQDIELPEDLKRVMARQASAEREKRATITKAEGDRDAAENLAMAAKRMAESPGALQLRTLQTLDGLGPNSANTVVFAVPVEVLDSLRAVPAIADALGKPGTKSVELKVETEPER